MTIVGVIAGQSKQKTVLYRAYTDAILLAGGTPMVIPAADYSPTRLEEALSRIDVLLLSGGGDIDPRRYGASPTATLDAIDWQRDETELQALSWALKSETRVLGICRGAQMLAVATGGTLIQDLPGAGYEQHVDPRHDRGYAALFHSLKTLPDTITAKVIADLTEVNSHHHQAVDSPGQVLIPTAWTGDGVIEALEGPNLLAIQWHPEFLVSVDDRHLRPFQWLVNGERGLG